MKSLHGQYIWEREGKDLVEHPHGFATFIIKNDECYIEDIFVQKEYRMSGIATELANTIFNIARDNQCSHVTGTCVPSMAGATESLKAMFAYGFNLHSCKDDLIILIKEL